MNPETWSEATKNYMAYIGLALMVLYVIRSIINPDPRRVLHDHVMYLHGTLGTGKTAIAAHWAASLQAPPPLTRRLVLKLFRRQLPPVPPIYSSFELAGAKPLDLRSGIWPTERGARIIIDEVLLLEGNGLLPVAWFAKGCTLARQMGQQVLILSQASRVEGKFKKFQGTFGLWLRVTGVSIRPWGRLVFVRYASEPFRRMPKGHKAYGQKLALVWVPKSAFQSYNSRKIYGYTAELDGSWLDLDMSANAATVDNQGNPVLPVGGAAHVYGRSPDAAHVTPTKPKRVHRVKKAAAPAK